MSRPHAKVRAVTQDPRKCECGCNRKIHSPKRRFLPGHSQYLNPRAWMGDGRVSVKTKTQWNKRAAERKEGK